MDQWRSDAQDFLTLEQFINNVYQGRSQDFHGGGGGGGEAQQIMCTSARPKVPYGRDPTGLALILKGPIKALAF